MSLTVRVATGGDAPEIARLVERAYRGEASRAGWTSEADLVAGPRADERSTRALIDTRGRPCWPA